MISYDRLVNIILIAGLIVIFIMLLPYALFIGLLLIGVTMGYSLVEYINKKE